MAFEGFLKADTAINVKIKGAVAVADGLTPVTNLSLATADEAELLKSNTTATASIAANAFGAVTDADGSYWLTLTAGNLDTEGMLGISIHDDDLILPLELSYMVLNANVYDSLYGTAAADYLNVELTAAGVDAVWNEDLTAHEAADTVGRVLSGLFGDKCEMVNNQWLIYGLSGNLLFTFNLTQDGVGTEFNPDAREIV